VAGIANQALNSRRATLLLVLSIPPIVMTLLVTMNGVNAPLGDQWELVQLFQRQDRGELNLSDLWAQHNEHRLLFPRLAMFVLANISDWNLKVELYFSVFLVVLVLALLLLMLKESCSEIGSGVFPYLGVSFSVLLFSPVQWENWLWGWQMQWFLNVLGLVGAVAALTLWPPGKGSAFPVFVAMLAGVLGTGSLALGVLIWPACVPIFILRTDLRRLLPLWLGGAVVTIGAFAIGYELPQQASPLNSFVQRPLALIEYALAYWGASLATTRVSAMVAGSVLSVSFVAMAVMLMRTRPEKLRAASPWLGLGVYGIGAAFTTGFGRMGFGLPESPESRYSTIAILFLISTLAIAVISWPRSAGLAPLVVAGLALAIPLVISYQHGITTMRARREFMLETKACLLEATSENDPCLLDSYHPSGRIAWEGSRYLIQKGWGGLGG
jgi:hypothetical protein